ncbi:tyrosine--tRNA ligase [Mesomycoplasma lagogenitalium]|uniref:Tyrosine--tRNA ligase n=1 Tax=Mesomycoplasma lagogenitalium TaxID=171286 RepID=A0ABY8LV78_9BACT|nr:tyrosine--tRNA ligase [Mesomycoplasma lagogenitalium]WGI36346.1 tyrosine--tRNA ligase [Mesomycoplasma lagogenitalium]
MKKNIIKELKERGILNNISNENKLLNMNENEVIYAGFDPTATSLHLGNYIQICTLLRLQKIGIKVIALIGGATGMIGDPSFNESERKLLDFQEVEKNKNFISQQLSKFNIEIFDNLSIYKNMSILTFLREAGKFLNINYMIAKDSVANRLETGLSFTEFSYQLIQGWDFNYLYENYNVVGQLGGSDQWGNITSGIEIIRKKHGDNHKAFALTTNLLTDKNGVKFGKSTGGGSLWLNKNLTSVYKLYQFLLNQDDEDVEKLLKYLTFLSLDEIKNLINKHNQDKSQRLAQKTLAFEIVKDIHSIEEANNSVKITDILFNKSDFNLLNADDLKQLENSVPLIEVNENELVIDILLKNKIVQSRREFREFITQGALLLNNQKVLNEFEIIKNNLFDGKYALLKKGKRNYFVIKFKVGNYESRNC